MRLTAFLAGYALAGFLTFGEVYNGLRLADCGNLGLSEAIGCNWKKSTAGLPAMSAGLVWPVYWAGRLAIEVTKP